MTLSTRTTKLSATLYMSSLCTHSSLQPSNQSSRALQNCLISPHSSFPTINYGLRRLNGAGNPGIQGGVPDGTLGTGEAIYISERPFPQHTELMALGSRAVL